MKAILIMNLYLFLIQKMLLFKHLELNFTKIEYVSTYVYFTKKSKYLFSSLSNYESNSYYVYIFVYSLLINCFHVND